MRERKGGKVRQRREKEREINKLGDRGRKRN